MKEIVLSPFMKTRNQYGYSLPYSIAFVYPKNKPVVVVKGMYHLVKDYVEKHYPISVFRMTNWQNGESRGGWYSSKNCGIYFKSVKLGNRNKFEIKVYTDKTNYIQKIVRRIPHKWIPFYDKAMIREIK